MDANIHPAMLAFFLLDLTVIVTNALTLLTNDAYENTMNVFGTITFLHLRRAPTL